MKISQETKDLDHLSEAFRPEFAARLKNDHSGQPNRGSRTNPLSSAPPEMGFEMTQGVGMVTFQKEVFRIYRNAYVPLNIAAVRVHKNDRTDIVSQFKGRTAVFPADAVRQYGESRRHGRHGRAAASKVTLRPRTRWESESICIGNCPTTSAAARSRRKVVTWCSRRRLIVGWSFATSGCMTRIPASMETCRRKRGSSRAITFQLN